MKFILPLIFFIACSSTEIDTEGSEIYSGRMLYTAFHTPNHPDFDPNKLPYLILHDFETGVSKQLTDGIHQDDNPIFLGEDKILFDSKRPCSGFAADECPSRLFKMSINSGTVEEFDLELSDLLIDLKTQIADEGIYNIPGLLENAEPQLDRPKLSKESNLLAFRVSILANNYLVVYDLSERTPIITEEIGLLGSNFYWSPNENKLARLGNFTDTDRSVKIIDFSDNSTSVIQLPEDVQSLGGWISDGSKFLLTKSAQMPNQNVIVYNHDQENIVFENDERMPNIRNWFYHTVNDDFLVQKADPVSEDVLDIWLIDTEGNEVERVTKNGYQKSITDINLSMQ